jgi:hypothetical protein
MLPLCSSVMVVDGKLAENEGEFDNLRVKL